jgi:hypothetical protein
MPEINFFYTGESNVNRAQHEKELPCIVHAGINLPSEKVLKDIIQSTKEDFLILFTKPFLPILGQYALDRMIQVAEDSGAGLVYADYFELKDGVRKAHPLNDYQTGSVRDDFDFGPLLLVRTETAKEALKGENANYSYAALYDLRLKISQKAPLVHLNEYLYTLEESDLRNTDEKMFAYVDPKNRAAQIEMEQACTEHLKAIGAWLPPVFENIDLHEGAFPVEASVIIPVRNRIKTITDAIDSVLNQQAPFAFNLIIIDNHSTDGTTAKVAQKAAKDKRIIHLLPKREDLGIGGCWNEGVQHAACGRFSIQLDSDDVYSDSDTLAQIVQAFYAQNCAMLVGSYRMCNFDLQTIPPGMIDHKEWTPENGRNNALRINGLGAPRAFFTPVLRKIKVPNTSYGEDYALGLQFSRKWQIGRIYKELYLCRRWEDNSDASLDIQKLNANNAYKDKLRSLEISARQKINS